MSSQDDGISLGRQPTMADVAARAGVSKTLVSTVFRGVPGASPTTRARVLQAASDLGYRLDNRARLLRSNRTKQIGVVYQLQDAFHADMVEAIYKAAGPSEYSLVLSATTPVRTEHQAIDDLLNYRCEALLLVSPQLPVKEIVTVAERLPTVVLARRISHPSVENVRTADEQVVDAALEHLVGIGHRDIAHLTGGRIHGAADRQRSYRKLMQARGLDPYIRLYPGGNTEKAGTQAAEILLAERVLPTAVVAFNDRSAIGLMLALRQAGVRVPEDISIMGYDDMHMASLPFISLSTVGQDVTATAQQAIVQAVARLDDDAVAGVTTLVPPYLQLRTTTRAAPPITIAADSVGA